MGHHEVPRRAGKWRWRRGSDRSGEQPRMLHTLAVVVWVLCKQTEAGSTTAPLRHSGPHEPLEPLDGLAEFDAPLGLDEVDGVEILLAAKAVAEVDALVHPCVRGAAKRATKTQAATSLCRRDRELGDDAQQGNVISKVSKKREVEGPLLSLGPIRVRVICGLLAGRLGWLCWRFVAAHAFSPCCATLFAQFASGL